MDRDCSVSKHSFRSGSGNDDLLVCKEDERMNEFLLFLRYVPDPSIGYAKEVRTPNSNFSLIS